MTEAFHRLDFRVHVHATEEEDRVREALAFLSGVEDPAVEQAEGHHGNPISILIASLNRPSDIRAFWDRVRDHGQMAPLLAELGKRLDARGQLFLRFDKQEAYRGRMKLVRHDDVVSVKGKVAAYPARRERALEVSRAYLEEG
ncbi:MAG: exosome protein [Candidatus Thermoplasmatota archaeon]|nr:exosome protein [Candidatus Thermoplasmatota archaeon]